LLFLIKKKMQFFIIANMRKNDCPFSSVHILLNYFYLKKKQQEKNNINTKSYIIHVIQVDICVLLHSI